MVQLKALCTCQGPLPMGGIAVVFAGNGNITNYSNSEEQLTP